MINRTAIQQWSEHAPWIDNAQIEQDLIICRALVSIFSDIDKMEGEKRLNYQNGTDINLGTLNIVLS